MLKDSLAIDPYVMHSRVFGAICMVVVMLVQQRTSRSHTAVRLRGIVRHFKPGTGRKFNEDIAANLSGDFSRQNVGVPS